MQDELHIRSVRPNPNIAAPFPLQMSHDQSKSNFWIQTSLSVSDRVGRELTGEWTSGPSAWWRLEWDVACGTGVSMVRSGEGRGFFEVLQVTPWN